MASSWLQVKSYQEWKSLTGESIILTERTVVLFPFFFSSQQLLAYHSFNQRQTTMCLFCTLMAADWLRLKEHIGNIICSDILRRMSNSVHLLPGKCKQVASGDIWKTLPGTEKIKKGAFNIYVCEKSISALSRNVYLFCDSSFLTQFYP